MFSQLWMTIYATTYASSVLILWLFAREWYRRNRFMFDMIYAGKDLRSVLFAICLIPVLNTVGVLLLFAAGVLHFWRVFVKKRKDAFFQMKMITLHNDGEIIEHSRQGGDFVQSQELPSN